MRLFPLTLGLAALSFPALLGRNAFADDRSDALEELKAGYALKQAGHCQEAIPHFARSFELDATPKALLNRSDCEAHLGDLTSARSHARDGLTLAINRGDNELGRVATEQLAAIEKRLPRITIAPAPGAPSDCYVTLDGKAVDRPSLGMERGINPGPHDVAVQAPGRSVRTFHVTIAEGEAEEVAIQPGPAVDTAAPGVTAHSEPARSMLTLSDASTPSSRASTWSTPRVLAASVAGLGVASLAVGIVAGIAATTKHATLASECPGGKCAPIEQSELDAFHSLQTVSTVGYVIGAAGIGGGVFLWFAAPPSSSTGSRSGRLKPPSFGIGGEF